MHAAAPGFTRRTGGALQAALLKPSLWPPLRARLLVTCPDTSGIVATVTTFLFNQGLNVTVLDQHTTQAQGGVFFMRVEFCAPPGLNHAVFEAARPYHQAWERGVKVIGATAHYVTAELDQGPIIEQDTLRVSHRHTPGELVALGRDVERQVLARAVRWHLEDRVIVHDGKTVVFS